MTIALARRYLPDSQARVGSSSLSVTVTTGLGLGYPLTGILADLLGFRFAFWFAALFLITTIVVVWRVIPAGPDERAPRCTLDVPGALLVGTGLASLLVGVSERGLRNAFNAVRGMSPKQCVIHDRLHGVRRKLSDPGALPATVTDVATEYGFFELGRFAGRYKAVFGETPSATLRGHFQAE